MRPCERVNMRLTRLVPACALLITGTVVGVAAQQFASADVSSGDRPVLVPIEPCRLVDTRPAPATPIGPRTSPLGAADTLTVDAQQAGTPCTGRIPTDAGALSLNVTAVNPTQQTFLTIWADGDRPLASSLNPSAGSPPVPNAVTTELSATETFRIYNDAGSVNVLVDVNGYYENHDHDDRYYTEAEVDGALDAVDADLLDGLDSTDFLGTDDSATNADQLGGRPASEYPRLRAIIRMNSGADGYTVVQGTDPGLTITSSSPGVMQMGESGGSTRNVMESANCTSGFSNVEFAVYKSIDLTASPFTAELQFIQPDGSPLPFNGRAVYCTIWQ